MSLSESDINGSVSTLKSKYVFDYDSNGRLTLVDNNESLGVPQVALTYAYDANGNLKSVVDKINGQASGTTTYAFDPLDRVSQINQSGTGVQHKRVNLSYNALGQMATLNRYADLTGTQLVTGTTYTYDGLNRLQQLSHKANGSTIASYTYGYDAASRITSLGSQFANAAYNDNSTYNYDNTNQLAGADHNAIHLSQVSALIFLGTLAKGFCLSATTPFCPNSLCPYRSRS